MNNRGEGMSTEFLSIPIAGLAELVRNYVAEMEIQRTNDWCKCEWIIHPEDVNIDSNNCANCKHPQLLHYEVSVMGVEGPQWTCTKIINEDDWNDDDVEECPCTEWVDPPKRRMRRGDQHPECPVHTKEGFLLGFFEWAFKDEASNDH